MTDGRGIDEAQWLLAAGLAEETLYVRTVADDHIRAMTRFENSVLPSFGLPRWLPSR